MASFSKGGDCHTRPRRDQRLRPILGTNDFVGGTKPPDSPQQPVPEPRGLTVANLRPAGSDARGYRLSVADG